MRLLLAEDERELSRALETILKHNHYLVDVAENGTDALACALSGAYDGLILDRMMPGMDGLEVLRTLRERGITTPVLFLTARSEVEDRIEGLDAGADDYLTKPFAMGELLARVRALTRRREEFLPDRLTCGNLTLNRGTLELSGPAGEAALGKKEYQMLELLMRSPGRLISTEQFMEMVWGYDAEAEVNVVWVYLSGLRKKMAAVGSDVQLKAVRGSGYKLEVRHD